ncbi:MAG: biotin/lipoyl-binding protein, partial [Coriobacteriia bacterium]|nr:biotin/lipoyl-binding protein [Coriobacteriia bacterium]
MRRKKLVAAAASVAALAGVAAAVAVTLSDGPPAVTAAEVLREDLSVTVVATGRVEADERADIAPPVAAALASIEVAEGQRVKAGQVIAELDTEQLEAQLRQAQAAERAARAQLAAIREGGPTPEQIQAADEAVGSARDGYERAREAAQALTDALAQAPGDAGGAIGGLDAGPLADALVG